MREAALSMPLSMHLTTLSCEGLTAGAADPEGEHDDGGGDDDEADEADVQDGPKTP